MAITFIEEPQLVSDVSKPVIFKTKSDDYTGLPGTIYVGTLDAYHTLRAGKRFVFNIPNEQVVMTCVSRHQSPPNPNHILAVERQYSVLNDNDRVTLAQDFARNPILNKHYRIEANNQDQGKNIVFTARNPGSSSRIDPTMECPFRYPHGGVDGTRVNFGITLDLFFRKEGVVNFDKIYTTKLVHHEGVTSIDISKHLDIALSDTLTVQSKKTQTPISQLQGEYYCVATESYGNPAKPQNNYTSNVKRATKQLPKVKTDPLRIKLIQQPEILSFSGNPMIFKIQSGLYLDSPGSAFIGSLNCKQAFPIGSKIFFSFSDERVEMSAVSSPDESGDQFPADGSPKLTAEALAPYFIANYKLNKHYLIEAKDDKIIFTARKLGIFYNWRADPFLTTDVLGVDLKERENFKFLFQLFFRKKGAGYFENIYSEQIATDTPLSGIVTIDISKNIDPFLEHSLPNFGLTGPITCNNAKGEYYCQFAEIYGHEPKVQKLRKSEVKYVIKGGLSYLGRAKKALDILSPDKNDASKDRFLKQGGRTIKVSVDHFDTLYFINTRTTTNKIQLIKQMTYADQTTDRTHTGLIDVSLYDKIVFEVNPGSLSSKTIKTYSCHLVNQNNEVVSETITYKIDDRYCDHVRYFAYTSSLGSIDVFAAYGEGSEEYELSGKVATKYAHSDCKTHYNLRLQRKFKVSTGWLDKSRFDLLADFFLAEKKWVIKDGKALPISVTTQKVGISRDKNPLLAQTFEYQYDFDDNKYTDGDA